MTTLTASSSRPAEPAFAVAATLVAAALFLVGWGVLHRGFFADDKIVDTPVYERYGAAVADGEVPYRDFAVEYPPGALPVFLIPALGNPTSETFRVRFETLMAFFGQAMIVCLAVALVALGASRAWLIGALCFAALAPVALGPVVLSRFDLWPAALTAAALSALVTGRLRLGHVALGAAITAKLYAVVLAPLAVVYVWQRGHARRDRPRVRSLRRPGAGRCLGQPLDAGLAAAPDREPRRWLPARRASRLRDRGRGGVESRLAEPRRDGPGRPRRRPVGAS